jgi:uncharacterized metal-binding protein
MMFSKKCKLHLDEADMTRWQHFKHAIGIAFRMEMAAGAVFLHAFAPRYFKTYASDVCKEIVKEK